MKAKRVARKKPISDNVLLKKTIRRGIGEGGGRSRVVRSKGLKGRKKKILWGER